MNGVYDVVNNLSIISPPVLTYRLIYFSAINDQTFVYNTILPLKADFDVNIDFQRISKELISNL